MKTEEPSATAQTLKTLNEAEENIAAERERGTDRQTDGQTERQRQTETETAVSVKPALTATAKTTPAPGTSLLIPYIC